MAKKETVKIPEYQDDVRSKINEASGRVIAVYDLPDKEGIMQTYFDVEKADEDGVWYKTLATNWETTSTEKERIFGDHPVS